MARKSRKHVEKPVLPAHLLLSQRVDDLRISEEEADLRTQGCSKLASVGYAYELWNQIVLLQHEVCEVNLQIERQKFLIESLEPNVQREIITPQEGEELRLFFESKQYELEKVRDTLLKTIQWIKDTIATECG